MGRCSRPRLATAILLPRDSATQPTLRQTVVLIQAGELGAALREWKRGDPGSFTLLGVGTGAALSVAARAGGRRSRTRGTSRPG